ncbi:MAG: manganese efflux pump MntP [Methanomicrobiales archaeon HGW-Methanomicrobiales-1]|jgi:putative Mn2+ efflux pump MntP|nr:MAG: manganese efflux pump MntP [Methanomicrobiales archaeon HGW-Methanomicrobiales-1]
MDFLTPVVIGIGLSMDCFAVSLAIGTTTKTRLIYAAVIIAVFFGVFQGGMTVIGWMAGSSVIGYISAYDHWIAFILLAIVGGKMILEGVRGGEEEAHIEVVQLVPVIVLSLATSIDALAVGVSFGVLQTAVLIPAIIMGFVCFAISFAGVMLGERLEDILGKKMEIIGGIILILIGINILAEHMVW